MLVAVSPDRSGGGRILPLHEDGSAAGSVAGHSDLAAEVSRLERADQPRWLWASTAECYPLLLRAGVRLHRCHDLDLVEALLLGHEGRYGQPHGLAAAYARLTGTAVRPDPPTRAAEPPGNRQGALFDPEPVTAEVDPLAAVGPVYADQQRRINAVADAGRLRLLGAAESAGGLIAAELGHDGLPWRTDVHDQVLRELLGEPSTVGPPRRLVELTQQIRDAFGDQRLHPDSPAEMVRAFRRAGHAVSSTRAWMLRDVDHPAVGPLLQFKELYRIWTAHGWTWQQSWVHAGRLHAEYVPAGVPSGRWATRGGGALQMPKVIRKAVVADPGWQLVVADAAQLEPRILAAVSADPGMSAAAGMGDMYAALAEAAFSGDRAQAKVALLGAMYGQTGGQAAPALATLRRSYPVALAYVEQAARVGEAGGLVRTWLGRTCPPPGGLTASPWDAEPVPAEDRSSGASARARGRFTRNFVIQGTAAEWALALLAYLRAQLSDGSGRLVFFQHDEVIVHCPAEQAGEVGAAVHRSAEQAGTLLFGASPVHFPMQVRVVDCYADEAPPAPGSSATT